MKNIILVDIYATYLASALATNNVKVKLLVADDMNIVNACNNKYPNAVEKFYYRKPFTNDEFEQMNYSNYDLTYEDIEKYRSTQLKVEHFLHRELSDDASIQYRYLTALRFFLGFFNDNKIDAVISVFQEHGAIWDTLIMDIAKSKNIPVYIFTAGSLNDTYDMNNITNFNKKDLVNIEKVKKDYIDSDKFFEKLKNYSNSYKDHKDIIKVVKDKIAEDCKKFESIIFSLKKILSDFSNKEINDNRYIHQELVGKNEKLTKQVFINKIKNFYYKYSTEADYDKKYIYYPIHFEPEASIMARSILTNQLYIIKMLSENLPEGWELYVKEHPATLLNKTYAQQEYMYKNIDYYKSIEIYKTIKRFKNVRLINMTDMSDKLIKNSEAVASICGTALMETIIQGKPIIIFGKGLSFVEKLKDSFTITCQKDLENAISKIKEGFSPDYSDLDSIVNDYTFITGRYGIILDDPKADWINIFNYLIK